MEWIEKLQRSFYINFVKEDRYMYLIEGFGNTVIITLLAGLMGIAIGLVVAIVKVTASHQLAEPRPRTLTGRLSRGALRFFNWLCDVYLTLIRGTPVVVQLLIIYFIVFGSVSISKVIVAFIAFGINSGAYVAEIVRSGILSIDKGQSEAGRSLGFSYIDTMRYIVLPQAFKNILPALGNEFIALLKETSVAGYIAIMDVTKAGDIIRGRTYDAFLPLIAVALIYLVLVMAMTAGLKRLERRLRRSDTR